MFKKGDVVYSLVAGPGIVKGVLGFDFPVEVLHSGDGCLASYSKDGKFLGEHGHPVLFHGDKLPDWYPKPKRKSYKVLHRDPAGEGFLKISCGYYVDEQEFLDTIGEGFVQLLVDDIDYRER